ncbi:MAG TPA: acyltransferase family protein [Solirubrobacteraceae bacterium]|nr:acyltransferase family protein [Solirubrobacteraceae bacterium]
MEMRAKSAGRDEVAGRLPYQPGLDGLRALAVAGVFLYHAGVAWMPGGFLGVDLFFVLSGYLITSLLLREFSVHGTIDLLAFWGRRARRLFPAVGVVILFAMLAALILARDDLGRTRADALSAIVYLTNWHEIVASHSYFNAFGRPSLLQHLWSLAVEEQFYLLWPLVLLGGLRRLHPRTMLVLTGALAVGSCLLMWWGYSPSGDPSRLYYGTDTRAFTLLIGAMLAFVWPGAQRALRRRARGTALIDAAGVAALVGVLVLFVTLPDYQPWLYRGGFLLMALLGAVLVASASHEPGWLGTGLGWMPLRWLGARSYGIYLWHWPIMELTRPGVDVPLHGPPLILAQAILTTGAAALSYRYIEMPFRTGIAQRRLRAFLDRHTPQQRLAWVLGGAGALLSVAGLGFGLPAPIAAQAFPSTATPAALQSLQASAAPLPAFSFSASSRGLLGGTPAGFTPPGARPALGAPRSMSFPGEPSLPGATTTRPGSSRPPGGAGAHRHAPGVGDVLALGDSVMLGCASNLEQLVGHGLRVDAVVGRQAEATIARLAQYRAAGRLPTAVIVQIGDNGPVWYADMQHLRQVLRGVPIVVLVNVRLARSWQDEVNRELSQYARSWPQAVVADWFSHSSQAMLSDGVHPQYADRGVYARVVVDALRQAERRWLRTRPSGAGQRLRSA